MMGESKYDVLRMVPNAVKPATILIKLPASREHVLQTLRENNLQLPVVCKPDLGERGWMVRIIKTSSEIDIYLKEIKTDFIMQEFVNLPLEFGVFYVRFPSQQTGFVNSVTGKEFLTVTGDGSKTLQQLIEAKDRARLQWPVLRNVYAHRLTEIIPAGQSIELVSIGNHCLGTSFINCNHLINEALTQSFDAISQQIDGFYFGRFDLRCATLDDLQAGRVKILELNGCGAEPAHIYHPGASLWQGIGTLITHWKNLYRVSKENHARGVPYLSFKEGKAYYQKFKRLKAE